MNGVNVSTIIEDWNGNGAEVGEFVITVRIDSAGFATLDIIV